MSSNDASVVAEAVPEGEQPRPAPAYRFRRVLPATYVQGLPVVLRLRRFIRLIILLLLVSTVLIWGYRLLFSSRHKPLLIVGGASLYKLPAIPANDFAGNDLRLLLQTPHFETESVGSNGGLITKTAELANLFEDRLSAINHRCLVVYLSVQAASDSTGAYLIGPDSTGKPEQGYPIDRALQQLARCPASSKLLVLDVARHPTNVELGQLGNDFVCYLRRAFKRLGTQKSANLAVLCAANDGQIAWSSPSLRHSVFGLCTAYCFHGGPDADRVREGGNNNRVLSVAEYARFARDRVAAWALQQRHAVQSPVFLLKGKDFPVVSVAPRLTPMAFSLAARSQSEAEPPSSNDPNSPKKSTGNKPPVIPPSRQQLAIRLANVWSQHAVLFRKSVTGRHALLRDICERQLLRTEQLLLAGEETAADIILDKELPAILDELQQQLPNVVPEDWNLAQPVNLTGSPAPAVRPIRKTGKPEKLSINALVETALKSPSAENLAAINESVVVEAQRLVGFAQTLAEDERWLAPDTVRLAISARSELEGLVCKTSPVSLPIVRERLQQAEQDCRAGEIALRLGRVEEATTRFRAGRRNCRALDAQLGEVDRQLASVERFLADGLYLVQWLGNRPVDNVWRIDWTQIQSLLRNLTALEDWPTPDELRFLAEQAEAIAQRVELSADLAEQHDSWLAARAVLHVPSLQPARRRHLMTGLLERTESGPWYGGFRGQGRTCLETPACRFPLTDFVPALAPISADFQQSLTRLDPMARPPLTQNDLIDPASNVRELRARAGEQLLRLTGEFRSVPLRPVEARLSWQQWVRSRLVGPLRSVALVQFDPKVVPPAPESQQLQFALRQWRLERQLENLTLLPGWKPTVVEKLAKSAAALEPRLTVTPPTPRVTLDSSPAITVPRDSSVRFTLQLSGTMSLPAATQASLVLDWYVDRDRLLIEPDHCEAAQAGDGQLTFPLTVAGGATSSIDLVARQTAPTGERQQSGVTARVVFHDGHVDWLSLQIGLTGQESKLAELLVEWPSKAGLPDRLDLLAGQQGCVSIAVRKWQAKVPGLSVQFETPGRPPVTLPIADKENSRLLPVVLKQDFELPIVDGELRLRLLSHETLLDTRTLFVNVLDPTSFFETDIRYDSRRGTVAVQLVRIADSDSSDPIPIRLGFDPPLAAKGKLQVLARPAETSCSLLAQLPDDFAAFRFTGWVSVGDFARAFRFWLGSPWPLGRLRNDPTLELLFPSDGTKFAFDPERQLLPVKTRIDAGGRATLTLGFDQNDNSELDVVEVVRQFSLMRGRDVRVLLSNKNEERSFKVSATARDLEAPLRVAGLKGRQRLIGRLVTDAQAVVTQSTIHLLGEAPPLLIDSPFPATMLAVKQPLPVTVRTEANQAMLIDSIELGFDKNGNLEFDEGEAVAPLDVAPPGVVCLSPGGWASVRLPTAELPAGVHTLMVRSKMRVRDESAKRGYVDLLGRPATRGFTISSAVAPPGGVVTGVVTYAGGAASGAKVSIARLEREVTTDGEGKFRLPNVPQGKYELVARLYKRTAQAGITVKSAETTTTKLALKLDIK